MTTTTRGKPAVSQRLAILKQCLGNTFIVLYNGKRSYLVGSSRKIIGGLFTSSNAMASLLRCPPEISLHRVLHSSSKPS
jgi:hypothetical protein